MPHPLLIFSQSDYLDLGCWYKFTYLLTNSVDPDQLASLEANWFGSALFAKRGHFQIQQAQLNYWALSEQNEQMPNWYFYFIFSQKVQFGFDANCLLRKHNWLLRQKAITTPMRKSLDKQYRDTCICQWKLHVYLYLSMKKYIGNIVCLSNNINR